MGCLEEKDIGKQTWVKIGIVWLPYPLTVFWFQGFIFKNKLYCQKVLPRACFATKTCSDYTSFSKFNLQPLQHVIHYKQKKL